ncbi:MAG: hypothetical protein ACI9C1_001684 [Candidatus Aldehydirespiratoraceae bacterium]
MFFVLSTGRAGSRTIANVLSQSPGLVCTHEPVPRLVEETALWRYGELATDDYAEMLRESRPAEVEGRRYGESANRLSLGVPVIADVFPSSQFVWLVRDGREVVSSGFQRGWFDHAADTVWERFRLRGDRLGEVPESEWSAWSPFHRVCWLWARTNEIIREDLAVLDADRHRMLRLEDLSAQIGEVSDFLGAAPADWVVPRLNQRGAGHVDESQANQVAHRWEPSNWGAAEHEVFDEVCGSLMDELYPDWRETGADKAVPERLESVVDEPSTEPAIVARRDADTAFADVRSLRAEFSILNEYVLRLDRRSRSLTNELDSERGELRKTKAALARSQADAEAALARSQADAEAALAKSRSEAEEAAASFAKREKAQAEREVERKAARVLSVALEGEVVKLKKDVLALETSASFRLGHAIVKAGKFPSRAVRGVRNRVRKTLRKKRGASQRIRTAPRRVAIASSRRLAGVPGAGLVVNRLPKSTRSWLVSTVSKAGGPAPVATGGKVGTKKGAARPTEVTLGLRAVFATDIDTAAWRGGLDLPSLDELPGLANLDLFLTDSGRESTVTEEASQWPDAAVVTIDAVVPPLPMGLTPRGFVREHKGTFLTLDERSVVPMPPGREAQRRSISNFPSAQSDAHEFALAARDYIAVIDSGEEASLDRATALTLLCAAGLPVVVIDRRGYTSLVPAELLDEWSAVSATELTVELAREQASHRQRGIAHSMFGRRARFDSLLRGAGRPGLPPMSVSVTVATNRPDMVEHWARQLAVQSHEDFEVIAALHGPAFDDSSASILRDHLGDRLTVLPIDERWTLGDALNAAAREASGDLIVKWDDDDFYDTGHLHDLVRAKEYSGATLVGKSAEFAYLAGPNRTVRRLKTSTESFSPTICGATLSIARSDLRELGGWRRSRRRVDSMLIEDVRAAGGSTYRTSGFGFVMMRAGAVGHTHTWTADDNYFLEGAIDQRAGLALEFCGVRVPSEVAAPWL